MNICISKHPIDLIHIQILSQRIRQLIVLLLLEALIILERAVCDLNPFSLCQAGDDLLRNLRQLENPMNIGTIDKIAIGNHILGNGLIRRVSPRSASHMNLIALKS